jgi:hypothetical protein
MATQGDNDFIEKALVTMDILVKHFEKQKNKHVSNTEFHDAIMRAWYPFIMKLGIVHVLILLFLKVLNEGIHRYHFLGRIIIPLSCHRNFLKRFKKDICLA